MRTLSIRTALTSAMLLAATVSALLVASLGVFWLYRNVRHEAQARVNRVLNAVTKQCDDHVQQVAAQVEIAAGLIEPESGNLQAGAEALRRKMGLSVLNVCRADGTPVVGDYPDLDAKVPLASDPVLTRALSGNAAAGAAVLDRRRIEFEGGPALANSLAVPGNGQETPGTDSALFWWAASPLLDDRGRVWGLIYGGRALNRNYAFVDDLRDLVFGGEVYDGKPIGTVTLFVGEIRVATNVLAADGQRAVGTVVSDEVRRSVLEKGAAWHARAWVVDRWYLSAYRPLRALDGRPVGILYVGLLEEPYNDLFRHMLGRLLAITLLGSLMAVAVAVVLVNRIVRPLRRLDTAVEAIAEGHMDAEIQAAPSYTEIDGLAHSFVEMRQAITERDRSLKSQNEKLSVANRNYMETLGFVTHELKSPLAAMQSLIDLVVQGYVGAVSDKAREMLVRVKRNCEELQDMVKNYLDLARAERGELVMHTSGFDFRETVLDACVEQARPLFDSRAIRLEVECPLTLPVTADPDLMRIALSNYLSNAAKYGREGSLARVTVALEKGAVVVTVWNEGPGFSAEEGGQLFAKFTRLKNENTSGKRGSGLGLFLCKRIVEMHGGTVWAESEQGSWACFGLKFPAAQGQ